ncbi:metallophosphoesterase family protein [Veronia pacifica]|uniref:Serine/threonine protein phosphatase n=1 Tax=Veronia pacifica TaxID=1080227 RepID=A0A1C3EMS0_9GAMM|nr:metallophosphoesterase family protein [Veronia pacifica]ODA34528.1 serine/threonine protein phosphatase [Veronia pacifica]
MKIAAISDVHSNVYALRAVLDDIRKQGSDIVVNLGDILYGPIAPRDTFELLMENELVTIRGNQDRQIYEATADEICSNPTMEFIHEDLGTLPLQWMHTLPSNLTLNESVFLCHGTPDDDLTYLLENVESGHAELRTDRDIMALLNNQSEDVILCGHTHTPRAILTSSQQLIVNPGSVGLPAYTDDLPVVHSMENYSPHASYSIVEKGDFGWSVQHKKVAYDHRSAARQAIKRQRTDWAHFLSTGRAL